MDMFSSTMLLPKGSSQVTLELTSFCQNVYRLNDPVGWESSEYFKEIQYSWMTNMFCKENKV